MSKWSLGSKRDANGHLPIRDGGSLVLRCGVEDRAARLVDDHNALDGMAPGALAGLVAAVEALLRARPRCQDCGAHSPHSECLPGFRGVEVAMGLLLLRDPDTGEPT